MNLNFLHLSIIYSSDTIFDYLLNSPCKEDLFNFKEAKYGLLPIDYAVILQKDDYLESFRQTYPEEVDLYISEYNPLTPALCYISSQFDNSPHFLNGLKGFFVFTSIGVIANFVGYLRKSEFLKEHSYVINSVYFAGITSIFAVRSKIDEDNNNTKSCQEYYSYQSVNVTAPEKFETLQQYKKYMQDNQNNDTNKTTYVSIATCNDNDNQLNSLDISIFNNSIYSGRKKYYLIYVKLVQLKKI